jgi:hypothetical protein
VRALKERVAVDAIRTEPAACERLQRDLEHQLAALQRAGSPQPADRLGEYSTLPFRPFRATSATV